MSVDFNAVLNGTLKLYEGALRANLADNIFLLRSPEEAELDRTKPKHGPWLHEIDYTTRKGRITTYYKGKRSYYSRRTDCDCV